MDYVLSVAPPERRDSLLAGGLPVLPDAPTNLRAKPVLPKNPLRFGVFVIERW